MDETSTVQVQDLQQVHALVRNSLGEGSSNSNAEMTTSTEIGKCNTPVPQITYKISYLTARYSATKLAIVYVMESQRLRHSENISNVGSLGSEPNRVLLLTYETLRGLWMPLRGFWRTVKRSHFSPNTSSAGHDNNRRVNNSNQGSNNTPNIMDTIGNIVNNVSNVLRARQSTNNGRARRSEEQRRASINLNRSTSDEALDIIRMAISQRSNVPLSRLIGCVANFELPKNDAETLLRHFSNNKIGNFMIFAPVLSVVAELLNHISMSDLMKLMCVSGVKTLSKPGEEADLKITKFAECINSLMLPTRTVEPLSTPLPSDTTKF